MSKSKKEIFYQLISHRDFVDWVRSPDAERDRFWQRWLLEHPESREEFFEAREFILRMRFKEHRLHNSEMDAMLGRIISKDEPGDSFRTESINLFSILYGTHYQWTKVAAILLFFLVASLAINGLLSRWDTTDTPEHVIAWKTVENPRGQKSTVKLPDGSIVHLNYESRLSFPEKFGEDLRQVELEGEAFFEVERDENRPFKVKTGELETEVLGTTFNVRSFAQESAIQVSLVSGEVKVHRLDASLGKNSQLLRPGEEAHYEKSRKKMEVRPFDRYAVTAWREGVILFEDAGFTEFTDRLEKWYGVDFLVHGNPPKDWKVNGRYDNEKLEDILLGLQFVYDLRFKISGKQVILTFR